MFIKVKKPIEILEKELKDLKRSEEKSIDLYIFGEISFDKHLEHLENLEVLIESFKRAIELLKIDR